MGQEGPVHFTQSRTVIMDGQHTVALQMGCRVMFKLDRLPQGALVTFTSERLKMDKDHLLPTYP